MNIGDINIYVNDSGKRQASSNPKKPVSQVSGRKQKIRNAIAPSSLAPTQSASNPKRKAVKNRRLAAIQSSSNLTARQLQIPRKKVENQATDFQTTTSLNPIQSASTPRRRAVRNRLINVPQASTAPTASTIPTPAPKRRRKRGFFSRAKSFVRRNARTALLPGVPRINRRKKRR